MEKVNFEELIKKLEKDSIDHGSITGNFDGTYAVLNTHWSELIKCCRRLSSSVNSGEDYSAREPVYRSIDENYFFISGILRGLVAGRVITENECLVLHNILMNTAYPELD